jgi:alpha-beta hydrolase superfamily lysophospholipase
MPMQAAPLTTPDGFTLHTAASVPAQPRGVLLHVHGYSEHSGRYTALFDVVTAQNLAVYTLDHRGHGQSSGLRAYINRFDDFVDDLALYAAQIRRRHAGLPLFIYGHSMGALITLRTLVLHAQGFAGGIISGVPLASVEISNPALIGLGRIVNLFAPKLALTPLVGADQEAAVNPASGETFAGDPLNYQGKVRVRTGLQLHDAARGLRRSSESITLPLLIQHGAQDMIAPLSGAQLLTETVRSQDKTFKVYTGMGHEIMRGPGSEVVLADIAHWLSARC